MEDKWYKGRKELKEEKGAKQNTIKETIQRRGLKQKRGGKNCIQIKVIRDQEVKIMETIEKRKEGKRKKGLQIKIIKDQDVRIMQEIREVKQLKVVKDKSKIKEQAIIKDQDKERGRTGN